MELYPIYGSSKIGYNLEVVKLIESIEYIGPKWMISDQISSLELIAVRFTRIYYWYLVESTG